METIKGREYFRIPEWAQIVVFALSVSLASVALWAIVTPREKVIRYAQDKPSVYVVTRNTYYNLDGNTVYSLEWTINGEMQIPANFHSEKEMIEFEQYLYRMGKRAE
jgi:hypothetical protein